MDGPIPTGAHRAAPDREQRPGTLARAFDRLLDASNAAGTLLIVALGLLVNVDVFGRGLFSHPIAGVPELAGLAIVVIVFLQVPYCLRNAHLTRSEAFLDKLLARRPGWALGLDALFHVAGAAMFAVIAWASVGLTARAWRGGEYEGAQGVFMIPVWPVKLVVLLGATAVAVQFLRIAHLRIDALRRRDYRTVTSFAAGEEL